MKQYWGTSRGGIRVLVMLALPLFFILAATIFAVTHQNVEVSASALAPPDPEMQELLENTYLGHSSQEPDPDEPAIILYKYLEQNAHGYLEDLSRDEDQAEIDHQIAAWEDLLQQYPKSRHAHVAIGRLFRIKAVAARDRAYMQKAMTAYRRATSIGLQHGRIRHTREMAEAALELQGVKIVELAFGALLSQPKNHKTKEFHLALMDYADTLAHLDDPRAWEYFEQALDILPESNEEALNRYLQHLLNKQQVKKALAVLNKRTTPERRVQSRVLARLRQQALKEAKLDTASADAEVDEIEQRFAQQPLYGYHLDNLSTAEGFESKPQALVDAADNNLPSAIFLTQTNTTLWESQLYSADSATSPPVRLSGGATKLSAFRLPETGKGKPRGGLAAIGNGNTIFYRYYNGSSWSNWEQLPGTATDITIVGRPNGEVHIFIVDGGGTIYQNRSSNGQPGSWSGWRQHPCCVSKIAAAAMLDGTIYIAAQANTSQLGYAVYWISTPNGVSYPTTGWQSLGSLPGACPNCLARDLTVLAYKPNSAGQRTVAIAAIGADQCTVYQKHKYFSPSQQWDSSWAPFSTSPCYKSISSFTTLRKVSSTSSTVTEEGAYLLFTGRFDTQLYTLRHNGTAWLRPIPQGSTLWAFAAGADFTDRPAQPPSVHTIYNDDCRVQDQTCYPDPSNQYCYLSQTVNLAEILFNEARSESHGGRALVGWTVRNRARQEISCDAYVGGNTSSCISVCPDPFDCTQSRKDCCTMHGGTSTSGQPTVQFNDGHVAFSTLYAGGFLEFAVDILNGRIPDPATGFVPSGVSGCTSTTNCDPSLSCSTGANHRTADPRGPMEYLGFDYCAKHRKDEKQCKRYFGNYCGNTFLDQNDKPRVKPDSTCRQFPEEQSGGDNYFWGPR